MKCLLTVLVVLVVIILASPTYAVITFERWYGGTDFDIGGSVVQTTDGGYIITGATMSFGAGWFDIYLIKTDSLGDTIWTNTFGGTLEDMGRSVAETSDRGYIITGFTLSFGAGSYDIYLIKTDSLGNAIWVKTYGGSSDDISHSIDQTFDGGYIITGFTMSFGAGEEDIYLIKTDSLGDTIWTNTYGGSNEDWALSVKQTSSGEYIIAGYTNTLGAGSYDVYLIKTDSFGDTIWTKTYGGAFNDYGYSVVQTSDGGYIITGETNSYGAGSYDVYLIKTDSLGNAIWTKTFGGTNYDCGQSVGQTTTGELIIVGETSSFGSGWSDVYFIKTDSVGDTIKTKTYGDIDDDNGYSIAQTSDGGFVITGSTSSFGAGSRDVYLIKTDSEGNVGIEESINSQLIISNEQLTISPNPFTETTVISVQCQVPSDKTEIILRIYDLSGRLVKAVPLTTNHLSLGTDLKSGIYFLKIKGYKSVKVVKLK